MIDALEKDLAEAQAARKRLIETVCSSEIEAKMKYLSDVRFYDGYITPLKYALVLAKKEHRDKSLNPFTKGVER